MRRVLILAWVLVSFPWPSSAAALVGRHTWSGIVRVEEDLLVPPGSSLEILAGTRVIVAAAPGTKTDPSFWNSGTELTAEGALVVHGTAESPVVFEGEGPWGGIVAAPGGTVSLQGVRVVGAQEALLCVGAACSLEGVEVSGSEYGLVLGPGARVRSADVTVRDARVGLLDLRGASEADAAVRVTGAVDAARLEAKPPGRSTDVAVPAHPRQGGVELLGDYTVERGEIWRGEVVIAGRVTVAPGAVLVIEPGTRVAFRRRDSDGDGLGEGELLVLGGIRCLGSARSPVVFESAEVEPHPGDWDKVSLISSEDEGNVFRFTVFRHGTQALHAHFSRFEAQDCCFEANVRGAQFQESAGAVLRRCVFRGNKQALRFRDSTATVEGCVFTENHYAVHSFRCELDFVGNTVDGNHLGGFFAREGRVRLRRNLFARNRDGARMKDPGSRVEIMGNRFEGNVEDGLSLSQVDDGIAAGNLFDGAGLDLVSVESTQVVFRGNRFGASLRDALHLKGTIDVDARWNDWGTPEASSRIHDRHDVAGLGQVEWQPAVGNLDLRALPPSVW